MKKQLLMIRDIPLSVLAGYWIYTFPWASKASAIYCGFVVTAFCGCILVAINNSKRKMRRRDCRPRSANNKN